MENSNKKTGILGWVTVLTLVATVVFGMKTWIGVEHDMGGSVTAYMDGQQVMPGDVGSMIVFTSTGSVDISQVNLTPYFANETEYSVNDFSADYTVSGNGIRFTPTAYFSAVAQGSDSRFTCNEHKIIAHRHSEQPFESITLTGNESRCSITASVTHDGAPMEYRYTTQLTVVKKPRPQSQSFDSWKQQCRQLAKSKTNADVADIYYCSGTMTGRERGVQLSQPAATETPKPQPKATVKKAKLKPTAMQPIAMQQPAKHVTKPQPAVASEDKCGLLVRSEYDTATGQLTTYFHPATYRRTLVVWNKSKFHNRILEDNTYNTYYCTANDSCLKSSCGLRNGQYADKFYTIDVMEEDTTLLAKIEIDGRKVHNHTRKTVLCIILTADSVWHWVFLGGKWYGKYSKKFKTEVSSIQVFPVAKKNNKFVDETVNTDLFLVLIMLFVIGLSGLFAPWLEALNTDKYHLKNRYNNNYLKYLKDTEGKKQALGLILIPSVLILAAIVIILLRVIATTGI